MKIVRLFIVANLILALVLIGVILLALFCGLEDTPLVVQGERLSVKDVERIKQVADENDPRRLKIGETKHISISERDLNLFAMYVLSYLPHSDRFSGSIRMGKNFADTHLTILIPENPCGNFLNLSASLVGSSNKIALQNFRIGQIPIPDVMLGWIVQGFHSFLLQRDDYKEVMEVRKLVKSVQLRPESLGLVYEWQPDVLEKLQSHGRDLLLPEEEKERLLAYNKKISVIADSLSGRTASLSKFFEPLFHLAQERSIKNADPISENRSLLIALTFYVLGKDIHTLTGTTPNKPTTVPRRLVVHLARRNDLAKHFLLSAVLSVSTNSNTANVIGLFKEIDDSRGGSGFSFADLAADRAGVKLAGAATASAESAIRLQYRMKSDLVESHFMPKIDNLPEGIMEQEFKKEYGELDSETYQLVELEIETRLSACSFYQP